jgi:integrase/recombinase XerD
MTGLGRQAKVLSEAQIRAMLAAVDGKATTARDRTMILLSVRLGLRAKEIASTTWSMLTDAERQLGDVLALPNSASKGKGGRELPLPRDVRMALAALYGAGRPSGECVVLSTRGQPLGANSIAQWFLRLYRGLGFEGCSSHSGSRVGLEGLPLPAEVSGTCRSSLDTRTYQ